MTTPNQMMSKLAARSGGRMIGAVHQDDRHRRQKKPEHDDHDKDRRQQFPSRQMHRDNRFRDRLRDVQVAHDIEYNSDMPMIIHQHGRLADRRFQDRRQI